MNMIERSHCPVLLQDILNLFAPAAQGLILDGTFGGGGHTQALLDSYPQLKMIGLDCDPEAAVRAKNIQDRYPDRFSFYDLNFAHLDQLPESNFNGVLLDLGVSSFQLDTPDRGFSFRYDAAVDMRLNPRMGQSAAYFLEHATQAQLVQAVRDFGEEPNWRKIVTSLMQAKGTGQLQRTASLTALIEECIPIVYQKKRSRIHPATRTFQGIRIAVNQELDVLTQVLPKAFERLAIGGILAVISFHSLEDRIVKRFFRRLSGLPEHRDDSRTQDQRPCFAEMLTKRPIEPSALEIQNNPRSRPSKLRAIRKLAPAPESILFD